MKLHAKTKKYKSSPKPWLTITLCVGSLLLFLVQGAAPDALVYNRQALGQGEIWRLLTGHFVHCDLAHLGWNLAALLILGGLLEQRMGNRLLGVVAMSCLGVSSWLWFVKADLLLYCGLSGMLNGLLAVLLAILWQESRHPALPLVAVSVLLKIIIEAMSGQALFTHLSWVSVPGAHGAGLAAGVIYLAYNSASRGKSLLNLIFNRL